MNNFRRSCSLQVWLIFKTPQSPGSRALGGSRGMRGTAPSAPWAGAAAPRIPARCVQTRAWLLQKPMWSFWWPWVWCRNSLAVTGLFRPSSPRATGRTCARFLPPILLRCGSNAVVWAIVCVNRYVTSLNGTGLHWRVDLYGQRHLHCS